MCSAAALDETSSTLPYVDDTETFVEASNAGDCSHDHEDRPFSINIGWDENVAIEIVSDSEDEDSQECGVLLTNNFIRYSCPEDRAPAPYAESDNEDIGISEVVTNEDIGISEVVNSHQAEGSEASGSLRTDVEMTNPTLHEQCTSASSLATTVSDH